MSRAQSYLWNGAQVIEAIDQKSDYVPLVTGPNNPMETKFTGLIAPAYNISSTV